VVIDVGLGRENHSSIPCISNREGTEMPKLTQNQIKLSNGSKLVVETKY
jgi:hypothetical protein